MNDDLTDAQRKQTQDRLEEWRKVNLAAQQEITPEMLIFLDSLAKEGERSAVVLGAERLNVSLEMLLKASMNPPPKSKEDSLFDSSRPLSSFSSRIELAFRLGLIDRGFRDALNLIRNLRNDFAHATTVESLEFGKHASRLRELVKLVKKGNANQWQSFQDVFHAAGPNAQDYLICVMTLLLKLELVRPHLRPADIFLPALLDYRNAT
jgi:hypothetical protein